MITGVTRTSGWPPTRREWVVLAVVLVIALIGALALTSMLPPW
jgi:hypothetical protein